jgi:hypothetical protein
MNNTAISIKAFAAGQEAVPYTRSAEATEIVPRLQDSPRTPWWVITDNAPRSVLLGREAFVPNCLYSFPTAADGLVRTSVLDLSKFLCMLLTDGTVGARTLLTTRGIRETFSNQFADAIRPASWPAVQGLAWNGYPSTDLGLLWGHSGSDPGIMTRVLMHLPTRSAALTFANTSPDAGAVAHITAAMLRIAASG